MSVREPFVEKKDFTKDLTLFAEGGTGQMVFSSLSPPVAIVPQVREEKKNTVHTNGHFYKLTNRGVSPTPGAENLRVRVIFFRPILASGNSISNPGANDSFIYYIVLGRGNCILLNKWRRSGIEYKFVRNSGLAKNCFTEHMIKNMVCQRDGKTLHGNKLYQVLTLCELVFTQ